MDSIPAFNKQEICQTHSVSNIGMMAVGGLGRGAIENDPTQVLERNFSPWSICSVGIVTGATWASFGGTITVAIGSGGPPGVIYEFVVVSVFYWLIAASLAELASSMPSSSGVYLWASITPGPRYGRACGFFAGWWNFLAYNFATASITNIMANTIIAMYSIYHPDYTYKSWHVFVVFALSTWLCCSVVLYANKILPMVNNCGLVLILVGVFITILICVIMPTTTGTGYASNAFVWTQWRNSVGYNSNGFVFTIGMLNGAFAVGVPDCVSHLAEELPNPKRNIPLAIGAQMISGFVTALAFMIAIFYATSNLDLVLKSPISPSFPLAEIYHQATSSTSATFGLLLALLCPVVCTCIGTYITAGRALWALGRDKATPFSGFLGTLHPRFNNQFNATLTSCCITTMLGAINIGSSTAFNAFVGSFVILSTFSYAAAILPFILTGRFGHQTPVNSSESTDIPTKVRPSGGNGMIPGPFFMSQKVGYTVNVISVLYIVVFAVIFMFPTALPVTGSNMNYSVVTVGALTCFVALWWLKIGTPQGGYRGPSEARFDDQVVSEHMEMVGPGQEGQSAV